MSRLGARPRPPKCRARTQGLGPSASRGQPAANSTAGSVATSPCVTCPCPVTSCPRQRAHGVHSLTSAAGRGRGSHGVTSRPRGCTSVPGVASPHDPRDTWRAGRRCRPPEKQATSLAHTQGRGKPTSPFRGGYRHLPPPTTVVATVVTAPGFHTRGRGALSQASLRTGSQQVTGRGQASSMSPIPALAAR